jgi:hypothetical protein
MDFSSAHALFRKATDTANESPRDALPLAIESLRAYRWRRCLRISSASMIGLILSELGNMQRAERIFAAAYHVADGCPCCQPIIDRYHSLSLSLQGRHVEAIERATRALAARGPDRALCVASLGSVYYFASDSRAAAMLIESLELFPIGSVHHRRSLINLGFALAFGDQRDMERVEVLLPSIRATYKGSRVPVERAYLYWLDGGIHAAKAETLKGWPRRTELCNARDALSVAYGKFTSQGLSCALAVWSELLAVQAHLNSSKIPKTCQTLTAPQGFEDVAPLVLALASQKGPNAKRQLLSTLKTLRNSSCEGGSLILR